jgi:hypothetical protein
MKHIVRDLIILALIAFGAAAVLTGETLANPAVEVPLAGVDVVDLEGITTDGRYFYAVGSQSKRTGLDGDGLVRFTFDPATRQIGKVESVRAPVSGHDALVVPLTLRDANGPFTAANLVVEEKRAMRVPTGGDGLRSIEFDAARDRFVVITGAVLDAETADFRMLEWDGRDGAVPDQVRIYSRKLKPEGVTRARVAELDATVVVFDVGSYEVIRQE